MPTNYDEHANALHVDRPVERDLERLLNDETIGAASFDSIETRMTLTRYAIDKMWERISDWLGVASDLEKHAFWYYFTEDDQKLLPVPIEHVGCIRDTSTNRILLRTTTIVCVVIQRNDRTDDGYVVYNSYPSVALDHHGRTLDFDVMPYVMATDAWSGAPRMRRTFWRMCCDPKLDWKVDYDHSTGAITMQIREGGEDFGTVACSTSLVTWRVTGATTNYHTKPFARDVMVARAFPETVRRVHRVYDVMSLGNIDDRLIGDANVDTRDVFDLRSLVHKMPTSTPAESTGTVITTQPDATDHPTHTKDHGRKKALERSRRNAKPKQKAKKKPRQATTTNTTSSAPFKFTHVLTKAEAEPYPQRQQNESVIHILCQHGIPLYNARTHELLSPVAKWYPDSDEAKGFAFACVTDEDAESIRAAFREMNDPLPKPTVSSQLASPTDYADIIGCNVPELRYTPSRSEWGRIKRDIAHDGNWQPCVDETLRSWFDEAIHDEYRRHICRKADVPEVSVSYFDRMPEVVRITTVTHSSPLSALSADFVAFADEHDVAREAPHVRSAAGDVKKSPSITCLTRDFFSPSDSIRRSLAL